MAYTKRLFFRKKTILFLKYKKRRILEPFETMDIANSEYVFIPYVPLQISKINITDIRIRRFPKFLKRLFFRKKIIHII